MNIPKLLFFLLIVNWVDFSICQVKEIHLEFQSGHSKDVGSHHSFSVNTNQTLYSTVGDDNLIKIWDVSSNKSIATINTRSSNEFYLSTDYHVTTTGFLEGSSHFYYVVPGLLRIVDHYSSELIAECMLDFHVEEIIQLGTSQNLLIQGQNGYIYYFNYLTDKKPKRILSKVYIPSSDELFNVPGIEFDDSLGMLFLICRSEDGNFNYILKSYRFQGNKLKLIYSIDDVSCFALSADSKRLLVTSNDNQEIKICRSETGEVLNLISNQNSQYVAASDFIKTAIWHSNETIFVTAVFTDDENGDYQSFAILDLKGEIREEIKDFDFSLEIQKIDRDNNLLWYSSETYLYCANYNDLRMWKKKSFKEIDHLGIKSLIAPFESFSDDFRIIGRKVFFLTEINYVDKSGYLKTKGAKSYSVYDFEKNESLPSSTSTLLNSIGLTCDNGRIQLYTKRGIIYFNLNELKIDTSKIFHSEVAYSMDYDRLFVQKDSANEKHEFILDVETMNVLCTSRLDSKINPNEIRLAPNNLEFIYLERSRSEDSKMEINFKIYDSDKKSNQVIHTICYELKVLTDGRSSLNHKPSSSLSSFNRIHDYGYSNSGEFVYIVLTTSARSAKSTSKILLFRENQGNYVKIFETIGFDNDVIFSPDDKFFLTTATSDEYGWPRVQKNERFLTVYKTENPKTPYVAIKSGTEKPLNPNQVSQNNFLLNCDLFGNLEIWNLNDRKIVKKKLVEDYQFGEFDHERNLIMIEDVYGVISLIDSNSRISQVESNHPMGILDFESVNNNLLFSLGNSGELIIWRRELNNQTLDNLQFVARIFIFEDFEYFVVTQDNFYLSSKDGVQNIIFTLKEKVFGFDQFDLKFNRPDIVLERLGFADSLRIKTYHHAYLKRLKKMGFKEEMLSDNFHLPEIEIKNIADLPNLTQNAEVQLELFMNDSIQKLDRINVWVNDVAIYGIDGISLRDKDVMEYTTNLEVFLAKGMNKVQVSVLNQAGAESYKETINIECTTGKDKPDLYLITIGESEFQQSDFNLTYASKDAQDMVSLLEESPAYENVFSKTLVNEEVTKENVLALSSFIDKAGINDVVMIFIAGHGVLDANLDYFFATYDMDFMNPAEKGLAYEDLEGLLNGIKPLKKTLLIDACHSGEIDKEDVEFAESENVSNENLQFRAVGENVKPKLGMENTSELTKSLFTDLRKGTGATVISSAGGMEFAMESDDWKNGLFTYCILMGIKSKKADSNGDDEIWLSEIQKYVSKKVFELSGGKQQPTSRIENQTVDFRVW